MIINKNPIMFSWWGFLFYGSDLMILILITQKQHLMIAKIITWICSKLKTESETRDPFGDDPFIVL